VLIGFFAAVFFAYRALLRSQLRAPAPSAPTVEEATS